ncbi:MAG: ATPase [Bacteroidetes bacterium]|nr:MAG: ATPase [Bacteroidota bacterium]
MNWHLINKEEALQLTGSLPTGLSVTQSEERLQVYGRNELFEKKKKPAWLLFLLQFKDTMILILLAAAVLSGMIGDVKDTVVILIIVGFNAVVGFVQEYRAEKAMDALKKMSAPSATVLRNGLPVQVGATELVPGDVVLLEAGNMVPADIRLLESHSIKIEEASLTGESHAVEKQTDELHGEQLPLGDRTNMAYKSTLVTYGRGSGVVVATGMNTEIGRIAQLLQEDEVLTPLQVRLAEFSKKLSFAILSICAVIYATGLLRGEDPLRMLMTAISVAVAGIPEALPAVVTIALALGAQRMVQKNALIRKLPSVETLGSVTFICTDKTGTLTQNQMTVTQIWTVDGSPQAVDGLQETETPPLFVPLASHLTPKDGLLLAMSLNHNVKKDESGELVGESTEVALAVFGEANLTALRPADYPRVAELPFDSVRKMMTTVHRRSDGKFLVIAKGALEAVLEACADDTDETAMTATAEKMAANGLRVLAYGYRVLDELPGERDFSSLETRLQCLGIAGMMDPPREEATQAIADCQAAGIVPVMITGDHPVTATAIARQIGILTSPDDRIITGAALLKLPEQEFKEEIERIKVYARVSPEQKLQIVKALQSKGQFVAMTGDGVNDAPALRRANIGVAMGITGTDVSKEAAHMILLDDNFATIVKAVREGRRIFENIRKFIKYILTGNSGEIWTIFLAPLAGLPIPLLPIQILWVNLVTDGLPALALAGEPAEKNIMQLPPRKPGESIFAHGLGWHVLWVGLLIGAICLGVQAWAMHHDDPKWQTYVFTVLCFCQMTHVLAIRSEHFFLFRQGIFSNLPLIGAILFTFVMQLALLYVPFLQKIFSTQALTWAELGGCIAVSFIVFHAVEMEKLVRKWRKNQRGGVVQPIKTGSR